MPTRTDQEADFILWMIILLVLTVAYITGDQSQIPDSWY